MMREILFRGKGLNFGNWVEGALVNTTDGVAIFEQNAHWVDGGEWQMFDFDFVAPDTVGQYTGLTDKNGKKIFEGDKVAVLNPKPFARTTGTVVFIDGCFEVKFHREDYGRDYLKCLTCNHECEVIGNIYDNPELLKGET